MNPWTPLRGSGDRERKWVKNSLKRAKNKAFALNKVKMDQTGLKMDRKGLKMDQKGLKKGCSYCLKKHDLRHLGAVHK